MRTLAVLFSLLAVASAQSLEERLAAKLASPFLENADWELDYDAAVRKAKASGKLVFGYFTRSYAP